MLRSTPIEKPRTVPGTFNATAGRSTRVIAVPRRQPTPQDSGVPMLAGVAAYIAALPVLAVLSCLALAVGAF